MHFNSPSEAFKFKEQGVSSTANVLAAAAGVDCCICRELGRDLLNHRAVCEKDRSDT